MLDLQRYDAIHLRRHPPVQALIADTYLRANYALAGVQIAFEGEERLPAEPVIFAMNHTDKYNFWPFQYHLRATHGRYTATWVKGKNYDHPLLRRFMEATNNIPLASRGYLLTRDFLDVVGRLPTDEEYAALRGWVEGDARPSMLPEAIGVRARSILGRPFDPERESYPEAMRALFDAMMRRFVAVNEHAMDIGLDLLVFPQGSTSIRLSRGHIGLAQIALHLNRPIVPVASNHCDRLYPGGSPWAKSGKVVYRFAEPLGREVLAEYAIEGGFAPFSEEAETLHRERFQALVDEVMDRIDTELDPRHRYTEDRRSDGKTGARRFVR